MELTLLFIIGFLSSFFGSFASGTTSMLSLTGLLTLGLPSWTALATHRFGLFGYNLGGIREFHKEDKIDWKLTVPLTLIGVVAAYIGSQIVLAVNQNLLKEIIGYIILVFIPIMLFKPDLGVIHTQVSKLKKSLGYTVYFFATVWGGSFNIGVGIFFSYIHMYFFGQTILETKATDKIPGLLKNITVLGAFFMAGIVNFQFGLMYLLGMFIGSTLAAKVMLKIGDVWLRNILFFAIGLLALRLVFGW